MRPWLIVILAVWAGGCTKDYGDFRFPKGTIPAVDAGDAAAPDGD